MPANFDRARKSARDLLDKYQITKAPIDPEVISEREGIDVVYATFREDISDQVAGFSEPHNGRIVVNRALNLNRKTFTIAHELGHHKLHSEYLDDEGRYQIFPRMNDYIGVKPPEEQEADAFAAELLVPLNLLRKYVDFATPAELAAMFMVSRDVILNRIKWL